MVSWSDWRSLGGKADWPAVARNTNGALEVFVIGEGDALYHKFQIISFVVDDKTVTSGR